MKKKIFGVLLAATMVVSLVGCGGKKNDADTSNKGISASEYANTVKENAEVYKKFVKLPEYKGLSVAVDKSKLEVSDEEVEAQVQSLLSKYSTVEKHESGVTAKGDSIILDYSGKLDGVAFSGGTATDASYTIGSGLFIQDLDKGLVGLNVGQNYEIPCKFPDDYSNKDMAGKEVVFEVKVTAIQETIYPELTDEWVAGKAEELELEGEYTVDGLKKNIRTMLEEQAKQSFDSAKFLTALEQIINNANIENYPEKELESLKNTWKANVKSDYETNKELYSSYYGMESYEAYISKAYGCEDETALDAFALDTAKDYLKEKMVVTLIAAENNIDVSEQDIKDLGVKYAEYYSYESYDKMVEEFGSEINAELGYDVLHTKVQELVNSLSVEVEEESKSAEETTSDK